MEKSTPFFAFASGPFDPLLFQVGFVSKYSQHHNLRRGLPMSLLRCADLVLMVSAVNVSILLMSPRARLLARPPLQYL